MVVIPAESPTMFAAKAMMVAIASRRSRVSRSFLPANWRS